MDKNDFVFLGITEFQNDNLFLFLLWKEGKCLNLRIEYLFFIKGD
jgi:hypothetical protein